MGTDLQLGSFEVIFLRYSRMMGQFIQIIEMVFKDERDSLKVSLSTVTEGDA